MEERNAVANLREGGTLMLKTSDGKSEVGLKEEDLPIEYLLSHFGIMVSIYIYSYLSVVLCV